MFFKIFTCYNIGSRLLYSVQREISSRWMIPLAACLLLTAVVIQGCFSPTGYTKNKEQIIVARKKGGEIYSNENLNQLLQEELTYFKVFLKNTITGKKGKLEGRVPDREVQSAFERWQQAQAIRFHRALNKEDPVAALLDVWAETEALLDLLEKGEGTAGLRGYAYTLALKNINSCRSKLDSLARTYLPPATYQEIYSKIEQYIQTNPLSGEILMPSEEKTDKDTFSLWSFGQDAVSSIVDLSFLPGRLAGGVAEGGIAFLQLRSTIAEATRVADNLPQRIRQELEMLMKTLNEQHDEVMELMIKMEAITANTRTTAEQAQQTAAQVDKSLHTARQAMPMLKETVQSIEKAAATSRDLTDAVKELWQDFEKERHPASASEDARQFEINDYKQTAEAISQSAREVRSVLATIRKLNEQGEDSGQSGRQSNFEITEYRDTAQAIQRSASELRELLTEFRTLTADDELKGALATTGSQIQQSSDEIANRSERVIDHIAWRAIQLMLILFLFATVYSWLRLRVLRRQK